MPRNLSLFYLYKHWVIMEMKADILIVGAGASGLMAAVGATKILGPSGKVFVLEKMPRPSRKVMITGKGRCNFTNAKPWNEFAAHIHPKADFIKPAFYNLTPEAMISYLQELGLDTVVERGDRAFPASHSAADVVDALVRGAEKAGAQIICNIEVRSCHHSKDCFVVECSDNQVFTASRLIICTGGLSYPSTGSTGDGYDFAKFMGHTVTRLFPSLTALVPKGYKITSQSGHIDRGTPLSELGKLLCGNQLKNIGLSLFIDGNQILYEFGDMDFTDGGLEGPIGFKISRKAVQALANGAKVSIEIDLKPAVELSSLSSRISRLFDEISKDGRNAAKPYRERFRLLLSKLLPLSILPAFIRLNPNADHKTLAKNLKSWKMDIVGYVGYERCVVTAGGINLDEVIAKTLESRIVKGLYFAGEVLDIDADTGGYNLQSAFSTGFLAGMSAARSI